jgi:hypothetical protein
MKTKTITPSVIRCRFNASMLQRFNVLAVAIALGSLALSPIASAVAPPPDGGYPGGNTAEGQAALSSLTSGTYNTAVGFLSLRSNIEGNFNTAIGAGTLLLNTAASNTAIGAGALLSNTLGFDNTANGAFALFSNTEGRGNTANGSEALVGNTTGNFNTATGDGALAANTEGAFNTASGLDALEGNTTGNNNTAVGTEALGNSNGDNNTAIGGSALSSNSTGGGNTALGDSAGHDLTTGNNNVCIGAGVIGVAGESNTTRIRNIGSTPIVGGINVVIESTSEFGDHRLGYASSSRRYKQEIKPMDKASESLFALKPVTFRAKDNTGDTARVKHYGLIAEEVATVDPDLVVFNPEGTPETLCFDSINAMLLNEFLKEHKKVEKLEATLEAVNSRLQEQAAQIQKVSAQVNAAKPLPHLVLNNP